MQRKIAPRQQINKYGCTGRSLLVLSFPRGMILGGEKRRIQLLKSPEHPDLAMVRRDIWDHFMI